MRNFVWYSQVVVTALILGLSLSQGTALAHCDTLDGPVIMAARQSLETGDVKPVLAWVQAEDEAQIRGVFEKTVAIRKLSTEAKEFADTYFFETLVRVHRAGEGAPYTGLKPAGQVEPAVALADKAIESGSDDQLVKELNGLISQGVQQRFKTLVEKKKHATHDVAAGREFVASYVEFVHYVERLHDDAAKSSHAHAPRDGHDHSASHKDQ